MSQRNFKYLHDNRIIYGRTPITDMPTESTDLYDYYENGTYQCYALFRSKAKITTYKSLKWHFLVIQHLNGDLHVCGHYQCLGVLLLRGFCDPLEFGTSV